MKKFLTLGLMLFLLLSVQCCTKTDVINDLEDSQPPQEMLTDEEANILSEEDVEFQQEYMQALADALEDQKMDEDIALIDEIEGSKDDKRKGKGAIGSCNAIEEGSTCLEYYGSFWTALSAELNCADGGIFSTDPCPRDFVGGCNTGAGTEADMVAWMYLRGGGEMTMDSVKYAKMACDATMMSGWIE